MDTIPPSPAVEPLSPLGDHNDLPLSSVQSPNGSHEHVPQPPAQTPSVQAPPTIDLSVPPGDMLDELLEDEPDDATDEDEATRPDPWDDVTDRGANRPELREACPPNTRSFSQTAPYFGFDNGNDFRRYLEATGIVDDVRSFDKVRRAFDATHPKEDRSMNSRPNGAQIAEFLKEMRKGDIRILELGLDILALHPQGTEIANYAIAFNRFMQLWFTLDDGPLRAKGIAANRWWDRVNAVVKVIDRAQGGYSDINKNRNNKSVDHTPGQDRTQEATKQTKRPRVPISTPAERIEATTEHRSSYGLAARTIHDVEAGNAAAATPSSESDGAPETEPDTAAEPPVDGSDIHAVKSGRLLHRKRGGRLRRPRRQDIRTKAPTGQLGLDTTGPGQEKKKPSTSVFIPAHTPDPRNPRACWFHDGKVNGYRPEIVQELQDFDSTDWACVDGEEAEPSFDLGTESKARPADRKSVAEQLHDLNIQANGDGTMGPAALEQKKQLEAEQLASMTPAEIEQKRQAETEQMEQLETRSQRLRDLRMVTGYAPRAIIDKWTPDADSGSFGRELLKEAKYMGAVDTDDPDAVRNEEDPQMLDPNDPRLRMQVEDAARYMENAAFEPKDYRAALNTCNVARRKSPLLPGQRPRGYRNLWWQTNAAAELYRRRTRAMAQRLTNLLALAGDPEASYKSLQNVPLGALLCDDVGIGKTWTIIIYIVVMINERKRDLQELYDNEDWDGLEAYPAPRPRVFITQPHLVKQTALELAKFSPDLKVYMYGNPTQADLPGVNRIVENLTRNHKLFDQTNEVNSQAIIVSSYQKWHRQHGPTANKNYLVNKHKFTSRAAKREMFGNMRHHSDPEWRAPHDLSNLVDEVVLDEAQNTKGIKSHSSYAIRALNADWITCLTATPIPYKHPDFGGMLSFVQSPFDNDIARKRIKGEDGEEELLDPYELNEDGSLARPADERFIYTAAAFEKFCSGDVPFTKAGPILSRIWARFMVRRDFTSNCVIDDKNNSHCIGSSMPRVNKYTIKLENDERWQSLHDLLIPEHLQGQVLPNPKDPGSMVLNGRSTRILGLAAISPLFLLARDVHRAKLTAERDSADAGDAVEAEDEDQSEYETEEEDSDLEDEDREDAPRLKKSKKKEKKVESPQLREYRLLFMAQDWHGWLLKLCRDIYDNASQMKEPQQDYIFIRRHEPLHPDHMNTKTLAATIIRSSVRLRAMFASIADQLDIEDEKALIFANNPWEQQLYVVLLRAFGVKSHAVLSAMKNPEKDECITAFQRPLTRWVRPGFHGATKTDSEVLVLSYYMNSGLNLHAHCHNLHAPSPAPSIAIWRQACGRIVRFGQDFECLVISYHVAKTYNALQTAKMLKNALAAQAALMCRADAEGDTDYVATRVSCQKLRTLHGFNGTLIEESNPQFQQVKESGLLENLTDADKFLRVLNVTMGLSLVVGKVDPKAVSAKSYKFEPSNDIFAYYDAVEQQHRTPKKAFRVGEAATPGSSTAAHAPNIVDGDVEMDDYDETAGPRLPSRAVDSPSSPTPRNGRKRTLAVDKETTPKPSKRTKKSEKEREKQAANDRKTNAAEEKKRIAEEKKRNAAEEKKRVAEEKKRIAEEKKRTAAKEKKSKVDAGQVYLDPADAEDEDSGPVTRNRTSASAALNRPLGRGRQD